MTDPRLHIRGLSPAGGTAGQAVVVASDGKSLTFGDAGGSGDTLGPENLQYDTIDVTGYRGQSDAGLRLSIPSHVSGDEATHPSVLHFPQGWQGWRYWMAFTPYTASNDAVEDPCIAASQDGTHWQTPAGFTNPLDDQPGSASGSMNSDTELVISPDGTTLSCIWRTVASGTETLYVRSTTDGVTWTAKQAILSTTTASEAVLSPAILHDGTQWVMWTVDNVPSPNVIRRRTAASLTGTWSAATACTLTGVASGREAWHLSVIKLGAQYVGLLTDTSLGGGTLDNRLYLMRSTDQLTWTVSPTQATAQTLAGNYTALYRGSLVPTFEDGRLEFDMWHGAWTDAATDRWGIYRRRLAQIPAPTTPGITVQDENVTVATGVTQIDFQGAGVTVSAGSGEVIVTVAGAASSGEVLMQDGVTSPPVPIETEAGDDWLYQG